MSKKEEDLSSEPVQYSERKHIIIVAVLLVVIVLAAATIYVSYSAWTNPRVVSISPTPTATVTPSVSPSPSAAATATPIPDYTWVTPEKLSDLGLFKKAGDPSDTTLSGFEYYKVGHTKDGNDIILAKVIENGMSTYDYFHRFIKRGDTYYRIVNDSQPITSTDYYQLDNAKDDPTTKIADLEPDKTIIKGDTKLVMYETPGQTEIAPPQSEKKIDSTSWGDLYRQIYNDPKITVDFINIDSYTLKLKDSTHISYYAKPTFMKDDGSFDGVVWTIAAGQNAKFAQMRTSGCGLGGGSIPMLSNQSGYGGTKVALDNSENHYKIFGTPSVDSPLLKFGYQMYNPSPTINYATPKTAAEMWNNVGVIVWEDYFGDSVIYTNQDFAPLVECGKPVIYLYPKKAMNVSVRVDAQITKSEPDYQNGWNVLAKPNGTLVSGTHTYPYLFWEGLGLGSYPNIDSGTVVARNVAESTINDQLSYIGLSKQEISDFLGFWAPKLPATPYVRLTWLQNAELDRLAPLHINPAPQSIIRVFLDFEGLTNKVSISSQNLVHYNRNGFTAVEWGGLLTK